MIQWRRSAYEKEKSANKKLCDSIALFDSWVFY